MSPDTVGLWLLGPAPRFPCCYSNILLQLFSVWFYRWYIWLPHQVYSTQKSLQFVLLLLFLNLCVNFQFTNLQICWQRTGLQTCNPWMKWLSYNYTTALSWCPIDINMISNILGSTYHPLCLTRQLDAPIHAHCTSASTKFNLVSLTKVVPIKFQS